MVEKYIYRQRKIRQVEAVSLVTCEYQEIVRKSDVYFDELAALQLPEETRLLIDRCISEQNALGSRYGMLAYQLGFTDCKELVLEKTGYGGCYPASGELRE